MTDTKMLQAILDKITYVDRKVDAIDKKLDENIMETKKNGERITNLGKQLAELEDDAPTVREFDQLEKRVTKLEQQSAKN